MSAFASTAHYLFGQRDFVAIREGNVQPRKLYVVTSVLAWMPLSVTAQVADANVNGTVVDASDAVVARAVVEITNEATAVRLRTNSDENGQFRFLNVLPGYYALAAEAPGFARSTVKGIALQLNRTHTVNIRLDIQTAATSVTVREAAETIDTVTPALRMTFGERIVRELPLTSSGSGVLNVSLLSAGVSSSGGLGYGTGPSIGGQRPTNNNFMIEGVDNNSRASTGPVLILSNEVVAEAAVQQNQFTPEFGHSSGGQFNTVVKSGTNSFRGSAFEYLQNRKLNALDASYSRQRISELPRFDQNRFGGTLGGPLRRDRVFFFAAGEGQVRGLAAASAGAVYSPTDEGISRLRSLTGISKTNLDVFTKYVPVAPVRAREITVLGQAIPVGIPNTVGPSYSNDLRTVVGIDAHFAGGDQLRGRWIRQGGTQMENSTALPVFYTPSIVANHVASIAHFRAFSPAVLNEVRLGFNRANEDRPSGYFSFPGLDSFPTLQFDDLSLTIGPHVAYPQSNRSNLYQLSETITWISGSHAVKAGYDIRKVNSSFNFVQRQRGEYQYRTLERYLRDITPEWGMRSAGAMPFAGNQVSHYAFLNDEWKLRRNVTANIGVRYEYVGVPAGARRQALNSIASVPGVLDFREPGSSKAEFAPRVGLAWSPGAAGRGVIRAGFGVAYDQSYHNLALNSLPPQYSTAVEAHTERPNQQDFLAGGGLPSSRAAVNTQTAARAATGYYIPDQQRPYALQWNLGAQQVIATDYSVEVRYLGTRGVHLPMQTQLNRQAGVTAGSGLPTYLTRPSEAELNAMPVSLDMFRAVNTLAPHGFSRTITSYAPLGNSSYHGLATQFTKRYSNGFQLVLAHTWSHNIDDSTAVVASTLLTPRRPQDFFDLRSERADSMLDHRHRATAAWVYDVGAGACRGAWCDAIARDWTLAGTWIAETGTWATVRSNVDSNMNADPLADRTWINPAGDAARSSVVTPLLNASGKTVAYLAAEPTARYIQAGPGVFPNGARNTLRLPGIANFDLSVGRRIRFGEQRMIHFRLEAYNALNRSQFVPGFANSVDARPRVAAGSNSLLLTGNAMFNRPELAFESNSRQMQAVLRLEF